MTDPTLFETLALALLFALAAAIHGAFGIGFPMITTSVMSIFIGIQNAIILTLWPALGVNLLLVFNGLPVGQIIKRYWLLALVALMGSLIGVYLLFMIPQTFLQLFLSLLILYYVYTQFRGYTLRLSADNMALAIGFGLLAGVVGGATNTMAPILLIYLFSVTEDKNEMAQGTNLCFLLGKVAQAVVIYRQPVAETLNNVLLIGLIVITIGAMYGGIFIRQKVPTQLFRKLILWVLLILAIFLLVTSLTKVF
ncbi:MAG: sulfite exporter TauE/SafE family protein [Anaerolineaceae bacterium]|nr:sulfite exporter TauE/SafE family protein [Anaerolineaceae bacterium]MCB9099227.1 sulfite exporter TauE/SafE family protein [Anaerolineales bacterium]